MGRDGSEGQLYRTETQHAALDPGEPMTAPAGLPDDAWEELWSTLDPTHGRGGSSGHVPGEPFALDRVLAAPARDRAAADAYVRYPATRDRVNAWLRGVARRERVARERATDPNPHARLRVYYDTLRGMEQGCYWSDSV